MNKEMSVVKLYGWLGEKYGRTFELCVDNVRDAVDLLSAQIKGFKKDLIKGGRHYKVVVGDQEKSQDQLSDKTNGKCIRIIPLVAGSGNVARVIVGAVLVYVGSVTGLAPVANIGWSLVIGGVIGLLFGSPPKATGDENTNTKTSYLFSGTVNTTGQGNQVPIVLGGPIRIGSQVISAGITTEGI